MIILFLYSRRVFYDEMPDGAKMFVFLVFLCLCVLCLVGARWGWLAMFSSLSSGVPHLLPITLYRPAILTSGTASNFLPVHQFINHVLAPALVFRKTC